MSDNDELNFFVTKGDVKTAWWEGAFTGTVVTLLTVSIIWFLIREVLILF